MAFYPQFPAFYAYAPMPYPGHPGQPEFYAMYPPGSSPPGPDGAPAVAGGPGTGPSGGMYYEGGMMPPHHHGHHKASFGSGPGAFKPGYNNRKISSDSGISDSISSGFSSRKSSSMSTVSQATTSQLDDSQLDDVKEEEPYEEPDEDLCEKIVAQVEFYFGDANITKDKFLLKHVKRNKEGFVSLKLISSFKRVKHLTKDWRQVAEAIERKSSKLEVNDVKTKVRRLEALPEYDETTPSRTVVALNLPLERPTIEAVAEIFSVCGEIVLVRILRPGNPIPADIKPFANKHPEMTAKVCALVEFEKTEFALKAVKDLNGTESKVKGEGEDAEAEPAKMIVMELTAPPPKAVKSVKEEKKRPALTLTRAPGNQAPSAQQGPSRRFSHAGFGQQAAQIQQQHGVNFHQQAPVRKISLYHNMKFTPIAEETPAQFNRRGGKENGSNATLNPNAPTFNYPQKKFSHPFRSPMEMAHHHPHHPMMHMNPHHAAAAAHAAAAHAAAAAAAFPMPAMMRRISGLDIAASGLGLPPNVVRMPRGPEKGARGFQRWCNKRMETEAAAAAPEPAVAAAPSTTPAQNRLRKPGSRAVPIVAPPKVEEEAPKTAAEKEPTEEVKDEAVVPAVPAVVVDAPAADAPAAPAAAERRSPHESGDSGNEDEGQFSEPEVEQAIRVLPQGGGFAAAMEKEQDEEKSR